MPSTPPGKRSRSRRTSTGRGTVSYLDVVVAQTTALANEPTAVDIRGRRMVAAVLLVKALGDGWTASDVSDAGRRAPTGGLGPG
jgi:outer membrane protein TolC